MRSVSKRRQPRSQPRARPSAEVPARRLAPTVNGNREAKESRRHAPASRRTLTRVRRTGPARHPSRCLRSRAGTEARAPPRGTLRRDPVLPKRSTEAEPNTEPAIRVSKTYLILALDQVILQEHLDHLRRLTPSTVPATKSFPDASTPAYSARARIGIRIELWMDVQLFGISLTRNSAAGGSPLRHRKTATVRNVRQPRSAGIPSPLAA